MVLFYINHNSVLECHFQIYTQKRMTDYGGFKDKNLLAYKKNMNE